MIPTALTGIDPMISGDWYIISVVKSRERYGDLIYPMVEAQDYESGPYPNYDAAVKGAGLDIGETLLVVRPASVLTRTRLLTMLDVAHRLANDTSLSVFLVALGDIDYELDGIIEYGIFTQEELDMRPDAKVLRIVRAEARA